VSNVFLQLRAPERREALSVAAAASGRPLHLLDKDVWLVWALDVLFRAPFADHTVFQRWFFAVEGVWDHEGDFRKM